MKAFLSLLPAFLLLAFLPTTGMGQQVLLEETTDDTIIPVHGPNLRHFRHFYFDFGFPLMNEGNSGDIKMGNSVAVDFGHRYKRKLAEYYAIGYDISYGITNFRMKEEPTTFLPQNLTIRKRNYIIHSLNLGLYQRINFNRRGNSIGKFLDLGAYGAWNFASYHRYISRKNSAFEFNRVDVNERGPEYIESMLYGVEARLGMNRWVLSARYRLSDMVEQYNLAGLEELPRLRVGLQVGFF